MQTTPVFVAELIEKKDHCKAKRNPTVISKNMVQFNFTPQFKKILRTPPVQRLQRLHIDGKDRLLLLTDVFDENCIDQHHIVKDEDKSTHAYKFMKLYTMDGI